MQKLTDRQQAVLDFISSTIDQHGYAPTLREIGNHLGIRSTNGVNDHLRALERKGYLKREDMKSRTLRPTAIPPRMSSIPPSNDVVDVPILGRVAAGLPIEAIENHTGTVRVDRMLIGSSRDVFGLRIQGESMIEAGIYDGDYVFVRKQLQAARGDIIVALVGDEATCKYYYPETDRVILRPANNTMTDIVIAHTDWRENNILGVVVGVYRKITG